LAVALTGAQFGFEASSFFDAEGAAPGVGQLLLVADPDAFAGREVFLERTASLTRMIEADAGARLPGTRRLTLRTKAQREGLVIDAKLVAQARALARA
jgi:(2R)-3-sulfolactate dehydrogenase (NADP+)